MIELILPKKSNTELVQAHRFILFVGACCTGKTRLGSWIEINSPHIKEINLW